MMHGPINISFLRCVLLFVLISFNFLLHNRLEHLTTRPVNVESHNVLIMSCVFDLRLRASKLNVIICFFSPLFSSIYSNLHLFFSLLPFTCVVIVIAHLTFKSAGKQRIKIVLIIVLASSS